MVSLDIILNWFKTGLKPKQEHFAKSFMSFRHKEDKIPIGDIEGVDSFLIGKADKEAFENHVNDEEKHGGGKFKTSFTPTVSVEGITAGKEIPANTTFEDYLKSMVLKYLPPTLNSLTLDYSVNQPLVGQPVTVTNAVFSFGNDSDGNKPKNIAIEWNGQIDTIAGIDTNKGYVDANNNTVTSFNFTRNTAGSTTVATLKAIDKEDNDLLLTTSKTFYHEFLVGTSNVLIDNQTKATTLFGNMSKTKSNNKNITINGSADTENLNNYLYFSNAKDLGRLTQIKLGAENVNSALVYIGEYTYNNGFINVQHELYRLLTTGAITVTQSIQVS